MRETELKPCPFNEQIEEIFTIVGSCLEVTDHECDKYGTCSHCKAVRIYNAGYRKQSEGEWRSELVKRCDWKGKKHNYYQPNSCSLCHEAVLKRTPFCPNCGAKMKGGAE